MKPHLFFIPLCLSVASVVAQDRFDRARSLPKQTESLVYRDRVKPSWLPDEKSFWYKVQIGARTHDYVLIDAETGARKTAKTLKDLGLPEKEPLKSSTLSIETRKTKRTGLESSLKFINTCDTDVDLFWINPQGDHIPYGSIRAGAELDRPTFDGHVWLITNRNGERLAIIEAGLTQQTLIVDGKGNANAKDKPKKRVQGVTSPDDKWSAFIDNGLVMLRNRHTDQLIPLKTDLDDEASFIGELVWSPNSSTFVVCCAPSFTQRRITIVESSPKDQFQPKLIEKNYAKPGDPLPQLSPILFRIRDDGYDWQRTQAGLLTDAFTDLSFQIGVVWSPDSSEFYLNYNHRGHQLYRILAVNGKTGESRAVVEETSKTFIEFSSKTWRHWLHSTGEVIWMSERDGWCHLYLYNVQTGQVKNPITQGEWPVREVLRVDDAQREVWFLASGLRKDEDPYHLHLCRVRFDGSEFMQLTEGDGNHHIEFSPKHDFFIDTWSRADHPRVTELRRSRDGSLVCELEKADASRLLAAGWTLPERFVAKGRDGLTDIHGVIVMPSNLDPAKKYPVVEDIYSGPHGSFAPKDFERETRMHQLAELGFIVVKLDGMGTNNRGKAFHDVCWKNLKDAGFPDRIAWIQAAAQSRPWMDLTRIGIYGGSAGGQNAMRALLDHHDFYKVAVADCGCHDNRMDKIWWNEQWLGWPVDASYKLNSNVEDAQKMEGQLLLIVGELDTNVDPATTMKVVSALQKAGKSFDFMPIMGSNHGAAETPYGSRLRMEFLVRHLKP